MLINLILALTVLLSASYILFLSKILDGLKKIKATELSGSASKKVSIIIPFRNEVQCIEVNVQGILHLDYDRQLLEVIYVDDASTDNSPAIIEGYKKYPFIKLLRLPEGIKAENRKKMAIQYGIEHATGEIIVGTDADCYFGSKWLKTMVAMFDEKTGFVSGPVSYDNCTTLFQRMQKLEFSGLVLTGAGLIGSGNPVICNGANLAYRRDLFLEVDGFSDKNNLSSGDDELLMSKILHQTKYSVRFCFHQDAVVCTSPAENISTFFQQRSRWASKGLFYKKGFLFFQLIPIFLLYVLLIALPFLGIFVSVKFLNLFAFVFIAKAIAEYSVLRYGGDLLSLKISPLFYFLTALFQPLYVIVSSVKGAIGGYTWKDRNVRR